jgi:hypothetical protein
MVEYEKVGWLEVTVDDARGEAVEVVDAEGGVAEHAQPLLPREAHAVVVQDCVERSVLGELGHDAQIGPLHACAFMTHIIDQFISAPHDTRHTHDTHDTHDTHGDKRK